MSSVLHNCNPVFSLLSCENNVHRKQEFLERQFFAPMAATKMYDVVV